LEKPVFLFALAVLSGLNGLSPAIRSEDRFGLVGQQGRQAGSPAAS